MRLFIAIRFSREIRQVLLDTVDGLRAQAASGNFAGPENLHLTLAFIGETDRVAAIRDAMEETHAEPFPLTVEGFGHFGDLWWVGLSKNPALSALTGDLQEALRKRGFDIERRPFRPHITVARQVRAERPPELTVPSVSMEVTRLSLMKSQRIGGKLVYTEIYGKTL